MPNHAHETNQVHAGSEAEGTEKARTNLREQYREIGISAVAAALHYRGAAKNEAYAPVRARRVPEPEDIAA